MATEFFQQGPELKNQYEDDAVLRSFLDRKLPRSMRSEIEPELRKIGARAASEYLALGLEAEQNEPRHVPFDAWGKRVDRVEVSRAWKELDRISAEEGLVATGYERKHGALSRLHQFVKIYLFNPSSAIYTCPLAMTDGAARLIEVYGDSYLKENPYRHLISKDPSVFWTSGQWMTERSGGSDVSGTETIARLENGSYRLYGTKWFTSAVTAQMAMTLARVEGAAPGSRGLSLFYLELKDKEGNWNNIQIHRLKDKLGTRALPTAELTLMGTPARLVGGEGRGVKKISTLFNITRIYNSCCAVSYMRRAIAYARDYAHRRSAFGKLLSEHPLHLETLADLQIEYEAAFHLVFRLIELLGKDETGEATEQEVAVLRLLTPIAKLYTAKQSIAIASEVLECVGGVGYVEDSGLPSLLRDCQTLSIWEGTTNVLSLDALRAIEKENALNAFLHDTAARLEQIDHPELGESAQVVARALEKIASYWPEISRFGLDAVQAGARNFAYSLARCYSASLLLEHAQWSSRHEPASVHRRAIASANRWCARDLTPLFVADEEHRNISTKLALYI